MKASNRIYIFITLIIIISLGAAACSGKKEKAIESTVEKEEEVKSPGTEAEMPQPTKNEDANSTVEATGEEDLANADSTTWTFKTEGGIASSPVCLGDVVYFGSKDGNIYAVDINTKQELWRYNAGSPILSQVAIKDNSLYFGCNEIYYAVDIRSGEEIWKYDTQAEDRYKRRKDQWDYHDASPVLNENIVYFGSGLGCVYGFDVSTGDIVWEFETENQAAVRSTPLISEGVIYFGDWNGKYYAVDIKSKQVNWVNNYFQGFQNSVAIDGNTLILGGRDTKIHAVDIVTGEEKWVFRDPIGSWISGDPTILNGIAYFPTSDARLTYAFNVADGTLVNSYKVYMNSFSKAVIYNDVLYITSGDARNIPGSGRLQAFQINGAQENIWEYRVSTGSIFTSPVIWKDTIYFGSEDGCLYAVSLLDR